jgi:hypothetical protein
MDRLPFHPAIAVGAVALFVGHLGMFVLPATLGGFSTPVLLLIGMIGSVTAAIRWL